LTSGYKQYEYRKNRSRVSNKSHVSHTSRGQNPGASIRSLTVLTTDRSLRAHSHNIGKFQMAIFATRHSIHFTFGSRVDVGETRISTYYPTWQLGLARTQNSRTSALLHLKTGSHGSFSIAVFHTAVWANSFRSTTKFHDIFSG